MSAFPVRASAVIHGETWDQGTAATATVLNGRSTAAAPTLQIAGSNQSAALSIVLERGTVWQAGPQLLLAKADGAALQWWQQQHGERQQQQQKPDGSAQASASGAHFLALYCDSEQAASALAAACERAAAQAAGQGAGPSGTGSSGVNRPQGDSNVFDAKIDKTSADMYFHYYGMLQHQQNMLQDMTRTGTYHAAIVGNRADFEGKVVMDVGAGSGILSLFAAQAGAAKVYAVEASGMAKFAAQLAAANPPPGRRIEVLHAKVEELSLPEGQKVDVLVSEPMGTLLVNERMLETYIYARDRFLKPGGKMFPQLGRIHAAAFTDALLYGEVAQKATFWQQPAFYGVDVTCLFEAAAEGYFSQVVVDAFDPSLLVSGCATRVFDFSTISESELHDFEVPLQLTVAAPCTVHGIATWFDVLFNGTTVQRWLSTAPGLPTTHWFQLRCVLAQPIVVLQPNAILRGSMRLVAHERQSYSVAITLTGPPLQPGGPLQQSSGHYDLKEPYYRQLTNWYTYQQQQQQLHVQMQIPEAVQPAHQQQAPQQQHMYGYQQFPAQQNVGQQWHQQY